MAGITPFGQPTHLSKGAVQWHSLALQHASPLQSREGRQAVRIHNHVAPVVLHQQALHELARVRCSVRQLAYNLSHHNVLQLTYSSLALWLLWREIDDILTK